MHFYHVLSHNHYTVSLHAQWHLSTLTFTLVMQLFVYFIMSTVFVGNATLSEFYYQMCFFLQHTPPHAFSVAEWMLAGCFYLPQSHAYKTMQIYIMQIIQHFFCPLVVCLVCVLF